MENLPLYVYFVFFVSLLFGIGLFYRATHFSKTFLIIIVLWIFLQSTLGISGFYQIGPSKANVFPPRLPLVLVPPILMIFFLFNTSKGKTFIDALDLKTLTLLHIIRVPIEWVLYSLFIHKFVPELMTFEGRNFDIFSGLTAIIVYYFGFIKPRLSNISILIWNFCCLALVINIAVDGILSAPTKFQQFAFEQPNTAMQYFPFVLLPSVIVPMVIFSHLVSIRQIFKVLRNKGGIRY